MSFWWPAKVDQSNLKNCIICDTILPEKLLLIFEDDNGEKQWIHQQCLIKEILKKKLIEKE